MFQQNNDTYPIPRSAREEATPFHDGDQFDLKVATSEGIRDLSEVREITRVAQLASDLAITPAEVREKPRLTTEDALRISSNIAAFRQYEIDSRLNISDEAA